MTKLAAVLPRAVVLALPAGAAMGILLVHRAVLPRGDAGWAFVVLAATGAAGLVALAAAALWARRSLRAALSPPLRAVVAGVLDPLGDAVLAFDKRGRLLHANTAALALAGDDRYGVAARGRLALGPDVPVLLAAVSRGPISARIAVATPVGPVPALAAAVRIPGPPSFDIVVLRVDPPAAVALAEPPPLPEARGRRPGAIPLADAAAAVAAEIREPLARAAARVSMLRLETPPGGRSLEPHLSILETELVRLDRRLSEIAAAGPLLRSSPVALDLAAAVDEVLSAMQLPARVRLRRAVPFAPVQADPAQLREALRHLLRGALAAMPAGGELSVSAERRGPDWVLEIADSGARAAPAIETSLAHALVEAQGGTLEIDPVRGRGRLCRLALRAAAGAGAAAPESGLTGFGSAD